MAEIGSLELTAGTAIISVALSSIAAFSPGMNDVLSDVTGSTRQGVDFGQRASAVSTVAVGIVLAYLTKSIVPLIFAVALSFGMAFVYEAAYRKGNGNA